MWREIVHAARSLLARPSFALAAIVTIALGAGANVAVFSYIHALLLRPLPFRDPAAIVFVHTLIRGQKQGLAYREVQDIRERGHSFSGVAAYSDGAHYNLTSGKIPEDVPGTIVTRDLFAVLGATLSRGEVWSESSDQRRSFDVLLSHKLWMTQFDSDPKIVGRQITMIDVPYTVRGVLPPGFDFPDRTGIFRCWGTSPLATSYTSRAAHYAGVVARLRTGVTIEAAQREIDGIAARLSAEHPETNRDVRFLLQPLRDHFVGDTRPYLLLLAAAVALIFIVSTANLSSLFLVRALQARRITALRLALGASTWEACRSLIWESALLGAAGTALGLVLARMLVASLSAVLFWRVPAWMEVRLDWPVLCFLAAITLGLAIIAGLTAVLQSSRVNLHELVKEGSRSSVRRSPLRAAFVAIEVALAAILLIGAGLLAKSFHRLTQVDMGYDTNRLLVFRVTVPWARYGKPGTLRFHQEALRKLREAPGVVAATLSLDPPVASGDMPITPVRIDGQSVDVAEANPRAWVHGVSPDYHSVMKIRLLRGRFFTEADQDSAPLVALVDERLANRLWPGADPIGKRIQMWPRLGTSPWLNVAGVVGSIREAGFAIEPGPALYTCARQLVSGGAHFIVRTHGDPMAFAPLAAKLIREADPTQAIAEPASIEMSLAQKNWQRKIAAIVFVVFAGLAAVLAAAGIFGIVAGQVVERTAEFGVRMALGASPWQVLRAASLGCLRLVGVGLAAGLVLSWWLSGFISQLIFDTAAHDPAVFAGAALFLSVTAVVAILAPAGRALRLDPISALRNTL
jgi:putative ABC transport system permease protein